MRVYRCYRTDKMSMNSLDNNIKNKFKKRCKLQIFYFCINLILPVLITLTNYVIINTKIITLLGLNIKYKI